MSSFFQEKRVFQVIIVNEAASKQSLVCQIFMILIYYLKTFIIAEIKQESCDCQFLGFQHDPNRWFATSENQSAESSN